MRPGVAIVLPAAFHRHAALRVLAGDAPGEIAPERRVHGVKKTARRISPSRGGICGDRVRSVAVEILRRRIEVRMARQNLPLAIHKNFLGSQVVGNFRLKDAVAARLPVELFQFDAATDDRLLFFAGLENNRCVLCAGILRGENQRLRQIISSAAQKHCARFAAPLVARVEDWRRGFSACRDSRPCRPARRSKVGRTLARQRPQATRWRRK